MDGKISKRISRTTTRTEAPLSAPNHNVHNQESTKSTGAEVGTIHSNWVVLQYRLQKVQGTFQGDLLVLKDQKQKMHLYTDMLQLRVDTKWSLDEIIPFMRA